MTQDEERSIAQDNMNTRKIRDASISQIRKNLQDVGGVAGMKTVVSELRETKGDASKVDIGKPNEDGFYTDEEGHVFCDIPTMQNKSAMEDIKQRAKDQNTTEANVRFDMCGFPKSERDREFILKHRFKGLGDMLSDVKTQWLFLYGDVGRGKTSLAIRVVWELMKDNYFKKTTFIPVGLWIESQMPINYEISDYEMDKRNKLSRINGGNTHEIVILDDFDKFKEASDAQSRILFKLIGELKNRNCIVIITSNRSIEEISVNCHSQLLPVLDRIKGMGCVRKFQGKSFR